MSTMAESSPFEAAIRELEIAELFSKLPAQQKLYAHHLSRAAWHGARIVMRQTSPESIGIFNLILDLHKACDGQWKSLVDRCAIPPSDVDGFLEYAALFLCNEGNFYVSLAWRHGQSQTQLTSILGRGQPEDCAQRLTQQFVEDSQYLSISHRDARKHCGFHLVCAT